MELLTFFKLMILHVLLDVATGNKFCDREFRKRVYIPKYADGLKYTNLKVRYPGQKTPVKCGDTESYISNTNSAPTLKFDVKGRCTNLTVISIIPDILINPPYVQWIVHNIPSAAMKKGWTSGGRLTNMLFDKNKNKKGDVVAPYTTTKLPLEDTGTGSQTVIYFVYCQCRYISPPRQFGRAERLVVPSFDIKKYAKQHGLKCPVTGLFHYASVTGLKLPKIVQYQPLNIPVNGAQVSEVLPVPVPPVSTK